MCDRCELRWCVGTSKSSLKLAQARRLCIIFVIDLLWKYFSTPNLVFRRILRSSSFDQELASPSDKHGSLFAVKATTKYLKLVTSQIGHRTLRWSFLLWSLARLDRRLVCRGVVHRLGGVQFRSSVTLYKLLYTVDTLTMVYHCIQCRQRSLA